MGSLLPLAAAVLFFSAAPQGDLAQAVVPPAGSVGRGRSCPRRYEVQVLESLRLQFRGPGVKDCQEVEGDLLCAVESSDIEALSVGPWRETDPGTLEKALERETVRGAKEVAKAALPDGWTLTVSQQEDGREVWDVLARRALGKKVWKCQGRATSLEGAEDLARVCASLSPQGAKMAPNPPAPKGCVGRGLGLGGLNQREEPKAGDAKP